MLYFPYKMRLQDGTSKVSEDQSSMSFCVAGAVFVEVGG